MHSKIMLSVACRGPDTQAYRQVIWWGCSLLDASVKTVHLATLKHVSVMLTPLTHGEAMLEHSRDA